jgi:hypothetical protein
MHVGQRLLETEGAENGAERLAGLARIDGQRLALEVEILVFLGGRPEKDFLHLFRRVTLFEQILLVLQRRLVVGVAKQRVTGLDVIYGLHLHLLCPRHPFVDTGTS